MSRQRLVNGDTGPVQEPKKPSGCLSATFQAAEASGTEAITSLAESIEAFEKGVLQDALRRARGNRAKAARLLSTTERIFNYKVRKYGIDWRRFKGRG